MRCRISLTDGNSSIIACLRVASRSSYGMTTESLLWESWWAGSAFESDTHASGGKPHFPWSSWGDSAWGDSSGVHHDLWFFLLHLDLTLVLCKHNNKKYDTFLAPSHSQCKTLTGYCWLKGSYVEGKNLLRGCPRSSPTAPCIDRNPSRFIWNSDHTLQNTSSSGKTFLSANVVPPFVTSDPKK